MSDKLDRCRSCVKEKVSAVQLWLAKVGSHLASATHEGVDELETELKKATTHCAAERERAPDRCGRGSSRNGVWRYASCHTGFPSGLSACLVHHATCDPAADAGSAVHVSDGHGCRHNLPRHPRRLPQGPRGGRQDRLRGS